MQYTPAMVQQTDLATKKSKEQTVSEIQGDTIRLCIQSV